MLKLTVRKAPSKSTRRSVAPKSAAQKTMTGIKTPIYQARIISFLNDFNAYLTQRRSQYGANDIVYKRLNKIHSTLTREMKKKQFITPVFARSWIALTPAFHGVTTIPVSVKSNISKLAAHIREQVRKDVVVFLGNFKTTLSAWQAELSKLDKEVVSNITKARRSKVQLAIDPTLKRRFLTVNRNFSTFKSKWYKHLNFLSTHGNKSIQLQVSGLKKQMELLQKSLKKNQTIINRYAKTVKPKVGYKKVHLLTASHVNGVESKGKKFAAELDERRQHVLHFIDQLKAVKQF